MAGGSYKYLVGLTTLDALDILRQSTRDLVLVVLISLIRTIVLLSEALSILAVSLN